MATKRPSWVRRELARRRAIRLYYLQRNARRRGLVGGERKWLAVFAGFAVLSFLRTVAKRGPMPVVFSEALAPGDSILISHRSAK
jgi:hypothetical protein